MSNVTSRTARAPSRSVSSESVMATLATIGEVFATFDAATQDSGHVSYGVLGPDGRRRFVKTAGTSSVSPGGATHQARVQLLLRTAALHGELEHPALVPLESVILAPDGLLVVQDWFDGELLRSPAARRDDPTEASWRFRHLDVAQILDALDQVIDLHAALERDGWVAGDFYDGSLMYDFASARIKVIDLESYCRGPYVNEVGRLPGSTRFMAPEELQLGARVDARTTVFNLARMVEILLTRQHPHLALAAVVARATDPSRDRRQPSVAAFQQTWRSATGIRPSRAPAR